MSFAERCEALEAAIKAGTPAPLAVNLAPSLLAIARAAADRPWWKPTRYSETALYRCVACKAVLTSLLFIEDDGHDDACPMAAIDAALDAAEGSA